MAMRKYSCAASSMSSRTEVVTAPSLRGAEVATSVPDMVGTSPFPLGVLGLISEWDVKLIPDSEHVQAYTRTNNAVSVNEQNNVC